MSLRLFSMILPFLLLLSVAGASAQSPLLKVSGDIVLVDGENVELRASSSQSVAIKLSERTRMSTRAPLERDALKEGDFVATTAKPQPDGTLLASEVRVFAEQLRGTGEGHRPMDAGNTMTNATVAGISRTGGAQASDAGTVADLQSGEHSLRMTLRYKGGEKVVVVPQHVQIVATDVGDRTMLVPGTHVIAYVARQPDGTLLAERLSIGKNGYVPEQ
ncbi:MAG TPA: DUF5666 domain-containing protein [Casimicrobiaceae bacterium]